MAIFQSEGRLKIQTGSYTGTGTCGASNPNVLNLGIKPKVVIISSDYSGHDNLILMAGANQCVTCFGSGSTNSSKIVNYTISGNKISWYVDDDGKGENYTSSSSSYQRNRTGANYNWLAIGV